jgi:hypothetical protein
MRRFLRVWVATGAAVGTLAAAGGVFVGCGNSTAGSGAVPDASNDGTMSDGSEDAPGLDSPSVSESGADTGVETSTPIDSGGDSSDATTDATDGGQPDATDGGSSGDTGDALVDATDGGDGTIGDAGPDSADAALDVADAAKPNNGPQLLAFANAEVDAICQWLVGCCNTSFPLAADGGSYKMASCVSHYTEYGWEGNLPSNYALFNDGQMVLDTSKVSVDADGGVSGSCIAAIHGLNGHCSQTALEWTNVTNACQLAIYGANPIGTACNSSFECAPGAYCAPPTPDGGVEGLCTALASQGQPCQPTIEPTNTVLGPVPDFSCNYLGQGGTGLYCDLIDPSSNSNYGKCEPVIATNMGNCTSASGYYDDNACSNASGGKLCGDNNCGTSASYPYSGQCNAYK